ncbi:MAG: hypothetical protein H0U67_01220 [Gemmatimonadetes bacterium]|nr:hypothetical protein [Gemmatimonadota bacterium]
MYDARKAHLEELRQKFDSEFETRSMHARQVGEEYLDALNDFLRAFNNGPAADPQLAGLDTTGELNRNEEYAAWVQDEQRRVRHSLNDVA